MSACARCGFALSESATKCLFCGHVVGAALPPSASPVDRAGTADPALAPPGPAPEPSGRIPRPTVPYRRPADFDADAASAPPTSPLSRPGFGDATPRGVATPAAPELPTAGAAPAPALDAATPADGTSLVTTLIIAALVGAIAGGLAFLIFIALRG